MLSRLSSFLRYTLINEPTGRVTVAQEVETLKLYLDIERMRFEERLRTTFHIDPASEGALRERPASRHRQGRAARPCQGAAHPDHP